LFSIFLGALGGMLSAKKSLLDGQFWHARKLARKGGCYEQKETCRLEMAVTLN
jgi:hypothetical protein